MEQEIKWVEFFTKSPFNLTQSELDHLLGFYKILKIWNEKINLVSRKAVPGQTFQHLLVLSLLYVDVIRKNVSDCGGIVDLGSGSGFPGIVMAILLKEKTIYLIESIRKKALFLKKVNDSLGLDVQIINQRIENVDFGFVEKPIITASFLDSIEQLIGIIRNNFKEPCRLITIRGDEKKTIGTDGIIIKKTGVEKVWMESWPSLENKIVYEVLFE